MVSGEPFDFAGAYAHPDGRELWLRGEALASTRDMASALLLEVSSSTRLRRSVGLRISSSRSTVRGRDADLLVDTLNGIGPLRLQGGNSHRPVLPNENSPADGHQPAQQPT